MSYLIDTDVLSETLAAKPNKIVVNWLSSVPSNSLFISVLTLGEIRKGVEKVAKGKKKNQLITWLEHELPAWFGDNIINIDERIADRWGYILATSKRSLPTIDTFIAASALVFNLKVVTRNVSDFEIPGLEVINPWVA